MTIDPESNNNGNLAWIHSALQSLETNDQLRKVICRESPQVAGQIQIDNVPLINFSSNDYLGIACDQQLVNAVIHSVGQVGWGSAASPLVTGRGVLHRRLEEHLAEFKRAESALLFPTGFAANVGVITALAAAGDLILSDEKNHASIIDGCRLSGATVKIYRHGNMDHLADVLSSMQGRHSEIRRTLIVTDSLFSMDGDFAPLPELVSLAEQHGAMLMVDEAHATGVWGERGSGLVEHFGVEDRVSIRVGTLSKALGSMGGFVAGPKALIDWIANKARTYMFSTAQPEAIAAASLAALNIIKMQPERRLRVNSISERVRTSLRDSGWNCGQSTSQIIPLIVGSEAKALDLNSRLRQRGVLVPVIRPPAVPSNECILRISLSYSHRDEQIDQLLDALNRERDAIC